MNIRPVILCALLAVTACATSPANRYYVLTPSPVAEASLDKTRTAAPPALTVSVPAYLDRLQIVTQNGEGQVDIREFDRWAEPVDGMIRRVLLQDMQAQPAAQRNIDLTVDTFAFGDGEVALRAHWTVASQASNAAPVAHHFAQTSTAAGDMDALVVAMSILIDALAQQIATSAR